MRSLTRVKCPGVARGGIGGFGIDWYIILARAGLLELTEEQVKNMAVCPVHRLPLENTGNPLGPASIQNVTKSFSCKAARLGTDMN